MEGFVHAWNSFLNESSQRRCLELRRLEISLEGVEYLASQWQKQLQTQAESQVVVDQQEQENQNVPPVLQIEKVSLYLCTFGEDERAVRALFAFFQQLGLEEFKISPWMNRFEIQQPAPLTLLQGLSQIPSLQRLIIVCGNLQGAAVGGCFHQLLSSPNSSLRELNLSRCQIRTDMFPGFLEGLTTRKSQLRSLNLRGWRLTDLQLQQLISALVEDPTDLVSWNNNDTLEELDLSQQSITSASLPVLARLLNQFCVLDSLNVSECAPMLKSPIAADAEETLQNNLDNDTSDEEATVLPRFQEFTNAIACSQSIETLRLGLTDNACAHLLFQALEDNTSLTTLGIDNTYNIDLSKALIASLPKIKFLQQLNANLDLHSEPLRQAFRQNTSLTELWRTTFPFPYYGDFSDTSRVLRRNELLTKVLPKYISSQQLRHLLSAQTFPYVVLSVQDPVRCGDASAVYALVASTALDVISWRLLSSMTIR